MVLAIIVLLVSLRPSTAFRQIFSSGFFSELFNSHLMDSEALRKRQQLFEKVREQIDLSKSIILHSKQTIERAKQQEERLRKEYNMSDTPLKSSVTKGPSEE